VTQKYIKKFVANLASHVWLPFVYCNVFNRQGHLKYWYLTSLHHTSCVPSWRQNEGKHCRTRWCIRMGPGWNLDKMIRDLIWSDLWYPRFFQSSDNNSSVYSIAILSSKERSCVMRYDVISEILIPPRRLINDENIAVWANIWVESIFENFRSQTVLCAIKNSVDRKTEYWKFNLKRIKLIRGCDCGWFKENWSAGLLQ